MVSASKEDIAFVLHTRRYGENSLLVEALASNQGRIALVARAPTRAKSRLGESLQPFRAVQMRFGGRGELLTLHHVEAVAVHTVLQGARLLSGMYLNELVMRLSGRGEDEAGLFDLYATVMVDLAGTAPLEPTLRHFEIALLACCGYGLPLAETADSGALVDPSERYAYVLEHGPLSQPTAASAVHVSGAMLLALAGRCEFTQASLLEAKHFMRRVLSYHLGPRPLHARSLFSGGGT